MKQLSFGNVEPDSIVGEFSSQMSLEQVL